jgi:hypothetical protein
MHDIFYLQSERWCFDKMFSWILKFNDLIPHTE